MTRTTLLLVLGAASLLGCGSISSRGDSLPSATQMADDEYYDDTKGFVRPVMPSDMPDRPR